MNRGLKRYLRCGICGLFGALTLAFISVLQKLHLGVSLHWTGFVLPLLVGGGFAAILGWFWLRMRMHHTELLRSLQGYQSLYRQTPVMLHSIDCAGRIIEVSDQWLATLGYHREEVIGQLLTTFFHEDSRLLAEQEVLPRFFCIGEVKDIPYRLLRRDGSCIEVLLSAVSERDAAGGFVRSLAVAIDVTERNAQTREVERLAFFDQLTGLPNRFLFQRQLAQELALAQSNGGGLALLLVDLDRFKVINDTLGHQQGDRMLQAIAERLRQGVPAVRVIARLAGDEFALLVGHPPGTRYLEDLAQKLLRDVARPVSIEPRDLTVTASIGIACYPGDGDDAATLYRQADNALSVAKRRGSNALCFFSSEMHQLAADRLLLEADLRRGLTAGEFFLEFQPQIEINGGRVVGVEALLRWRHPERGILAPGAFIEVAEASGLIIPLGDWVLRSACHTVASWQGLLPAGLRLAVNISPHQFKQAHFVAQVEAILAESGLDPRRFEVELTEGLVMENTDATLLTLADLKVLGIGLAVDDFGTGYSSLSYLKHFPFDRVKIAQEFVRGIPADSDNVAIVVAILSMAESLGLAVIAEGVETREQLLFLRSNGCLEMQGYYFSPALTVAEMPAFLGRADQLNGDWCPLA